MAYTKIWDVKDNLNRVVNYATNPMKTENQAYKDFHGLSNAINYIIDDDKTEKQYFVTGINCDPSTATKEMNDTKIQFNKTDSILAFHAIQSFKGREVTPELAHQIGIELANELWGDRFQVVVTTHLDKENYHNHFVLNSVSYTDGNRYYDNKKTYRKMQNVSDDICHKYNLSIIKTAGRGKHYAQWNAEKKGEPNWYSILRDDIDYCISVSLSYSQFINEMKEIGYVLKLNRKYITAQPSLDKDKPVRLYRLGDEYSEQGIKDRILNNSSIERKRSPRQTNQIVIKNFHYNGNYRQLTNRKITGLRALYFHYLYKLKLIDNTSRRISTVLKEDVIKMEKYSRSFVLLNKYKISSINELMAHKDAVLNKIDDLVNERKHLYNKLRRSVNKTEIKSEISLLSKEIFSLRKEVVLCDDIAKRSIAMSEKLHIIKAQEKEGEEINESRKRSR